MAFAGFPPQEVESGPAKMSMPDCPDSTPLGDKRKITRLNYIEPSAGAMFLIPFSFQYRAAPG